MFLIDCGEGTQIRIGQYKIKRNSIDHIFISHLHGDHVYGLPGLLTSMSLNNRTKALQIFGPVGLKKMLDTVFEMSRAYFSFEIEITELKEGAHKTILDLPDAEVKCFPVYHRIPCFGYLFQEKLPERNVMKTAIEEFNLSIEEIKAAKRGEDIQRGDQIILNRLVTLTQDEVVSYAFCADSEADSRILDDIRGVNVLYFETTYLDDMSEQAKERGHATSVSAAQLADAAGVNVLITGHYSSRYRDLEPFIEEIKPIFENVILGYDGTMINLHDYN